MISIQTEQSDRKAEKKNWLMIEIFFEMWTFPFKAICTHWHTTTDLLSQSAPTSFVYSVGFEKVFFFFEVIYQSFSFERLSVNLYVMVFVGLTSIILLKIEHLFLCKINFSSVSLFVYLDEEVTKVVTNKFLLFTLSARFSYVITKFVFLCWYL